MEGSISSQYYHIIMASIRCLGKNDPGLLRRRRITLIVSSSSCKLESVGASWIALSKYCSIRSVEHISRTDHSTLLLLFYSTSRPRCFEILLIVPFCFVLLQHPIHSCISFQSRKPFRAIIQCCCAIKRMFGTKSASKSSRLSRQRRNVYWVR